MKFDESATAKVGPSDDLGVRSPSPIDVATREPQGMEARQGAKSSMPLILRQALPGLVVLLVVLKTVNPVSDPDTFWHIATGHYLTSQWEFNGQDPWSDMSSQTWRLHEWMPQLLISSMFDLGRLPAVAWLLPLGLSAIMISLWFWVRQTSSLLVTALIMGATFAGMTTSLSVRPHLATFVLTVVTAGAWLKTSTDLRARWWLVPLTWVWACSHGMWFVAPIIGLSVVAGMALDRAANPRQIARLASIPVASTAAAAVRQ